jgi:hypothetical protein
MSKSYISKCYQSDIFTNFESLINFEQTTILKQIIFYKKSHTFSYLSQIPLKFSDY